MATDAVITNLKAQIDRLSKSNFDAGLKKNLGEISLFNRFKPRIDDLLNRYNSTSTVIPLFGDNVINEFANVITALTNIIQAISSMPNEAFVQQRQNFINQLDAQLDQAMRLLLPFIVFAQEDFLSANVKGKSGADIAKLRASMQKEAEEAIANLKVQAASILEQAKAEAKNIQSTARDTAVGVSVIGANAKFDGLIKQFKAGMIASGAACVLVFLIFFAYVYHLLDHTPDVSNIPIAIFSTSIRVVMLGSLAALGAFLLKIFKSNLNMYYHTIHRQQLTNSIEVFVQAGRTDAQRDAILSKLIEAVSTFGNSGLIDGSDEIPNVAKVVIETIPKLLANKGG